VKHTITSENRSRLTAENIIENGVRHTEIGWHQCNNIDDAIEKGVKETMFNPFPKQLRVKNIIENGVKEIYDYKGHRWDVKDVIQDGVKETNSWNDSIIGDLNGCIDNVIKNGVKETFDCDWDVPTDLLEDVINDGIKETKTPGKDGDILGVIDWMEENKTNSVPKMIDDIIENGVKETKYANRYDSIGPVFKEGKIENIIENGVKISGTFVGGKRQKENIESVIGYGTKNPTG
jgi:predicted peroxiredoxin